MDDRNPDTQPSGALVPPPGLPPTAVATSAPFPPPGRRRRASTTERRGWPISLLDAALDQLDVLGDRVASALGVR